MTLRGLVDHFENRLFELSTTTMMLGLALHLSFWPEALAASAFHFILEVVPNGMLALFFFCAAVLRLAALVANGAWPNSGPILRTIGAVFGALIWAQMCLALVLLIPNVGSPPSPGIPVYFTLTVFELLSTYRAMVLVDDGKAARAGV